MNMLLCLSGLRQSGKTTKLIAEFKKCLQYIKFNTDRLNERSLRGHYIMLAPYKPDHNLVSDFIEKQYIENSLKRSTVSYVNDLESLIIKIKELVFQSDCNIFIDDMSAYGLDLHDSLQTLLDGCQNAGPNFRIEIMYTRRVPAPKLAN